MDHHLRWYIEGFVGKGYLTGGSEICYIFCWAMLMGSARFRATFNYTVANMPFLRQDPFNKPRCAFHVAARLMKSFLLNDFDMYTGVRRGKGTFHFLYTIIENEFGRYLTISACFFLWLLL